MCIKVFENFQTPRYTYAISTFITEVLCHITFVKLFIVTLEVKKTASLAVLGWFLQGAPILRSRLLTIATNYNCHIKVVELV